MVPHMVKLRRHADSKIGIWGKRIIKQKVSIKSPKMSASICGSLLIKQELVPYVGFLIRLGSEVGRVLVRQDNLSSRCWTQPSNREDPTKVAICKKGYGMQGLFKCKGMILPYHHFSGSALVYWIRETGGTFVGSWATRQQNLGTTL